MRKTVPIFLLTTSFLLQSCGGSLDMLGMVWTLSDTPDARFEQSQAYNESCGDQSVAVSTDDYKLYVFTDQHTEGTTEGLDIFVDRYLNDNDAAPFCLCLGDVVDGKGSYPLYYEHISPIIESPSHTLFPALGNHDIYYDQWKDWVGYFKTSSYHFDVLLPSGAKDFFLCLDTASGTLGRKQLKWAGETLEKASRAGYRNIVVFTHTHLFKKDDSQGHTSNFEIEETYELMKIFKEYGVNLVLTGHDHSREYTVFGGVEYFVLDSLEDTSVDPGYALVYMGKENVDVDFVHIRQ